jgi:hypothetical protein
MLGPGELDEAVRGQRGLLAGIEACLERRCLVSSLTLMLSTIDVVSSLTRPESAASTTRSVFMRWVQEYMAEFLNAVGCSAQDICAARCGVLHTGTRRSGLSRRQADVKTFVYYWRDGPRPDPLTPPAAGAVHVCMNDLHEALVQALVRFGEAKTMDPQLVARVAHHEQELLCYRPWSSITVRAA